MKLDSVVNLAGSLNNMMLSKWFAVALSCAQLGYWCVVTIISLDLAPSVLVCLL